MVRHNPILQIPRQESAPIRREDPASKPRVSLRAVVSWAHLSIGLTAGLGIVLMSRRPAAELWTLVWFRRADTLKARYFNWHQVIAL